MTELIDVAGLPLAVKTIGSITNGPTVVMLHEGRVVWSGTVAELDETDNAYVRQFVSKSIEGTVRMPALAG